MNDSSVFARKLLWLTLCEMKSRYRGTWAGFLWVILNPLVFFAAIYVAFHESLGGGAPRYPLLLAAGLLPWTFVSSTLGTHANALCASRALLLSLPLDPWLIVGSKVLDQFVSFAVVLAVLLGVFGKGLAFSPGFFAAIFLCVANLLFFVTASLRGICALQVFFRDTQFVLQFVNGVMFFLTPIFYAESSMSPLLRAAQHWNPYYSVIHPFQVCLTGGSRGEFLAAIAHGVCFSLAIGLCARLFCRYRENALYRAL